ncbi:HAD family hydrolase [Haloplanus halobius]|uniref:HAD family hydrolase n=1 Tax=Haloplanus halobius TaxID=2934938 RepID=UPI00201096EC
MQTDHDTVVYDLDGTLVRLAVNWNAAARDATATFADAGVAVDDADLWSLFEMAPEYGVAEELEATLAAHEHRGAERSFRLPLADYVANHGAPIGVCSLNAEAACRRALDRHDLSSHVDAVVGRDSLTTRKPDPEPLLTTIARLGGDPDAALFVGDSESDAVTADRAGVAFAHVADVVRDIAQS